MAATAASEGADDFAANIAEFPFYASAREKRIIATNVLESYQQIRTMSWTGTAAISSIAFTPNIGTNIVTGSIFHLYGIG